MRKRQTSLSHGGRTLGLVASGGGLALLSLMLLVPIVSISNATEIQPFSAEVNTKTSVYVRSSIAVSMTSAASIDLTPLSTGVFSESSDVDLSVSTNNTTGYELYLTTGDNTSSLSQRNATGTPAEITPTTSAMTAENYQEHLNSWGYNIASSSTNASMPMESGEFLAVPKNGEASVVKTSDLSSNDTYTLKFGAAVSTGLPAGVYSNTVVASVVANPIEVRSLSDITTMQEMTSDICTISLENETKQLIDTRDNKSYWVAKLKDGRCWMVQNLALDLYTVDGEVKAIPSNADKSNLSDGTAKSYTTLTPDNTHITEAWDNNAARCKDLPDGNFFCAAKNTIYNKVQSDYKYYSSDTRSWDYNDYIIGLPTNSSSCGDTSSLSNCVKNGVLDVSSTEWQPTFSAQMGWWKYDEGTKVATTSLHEIEGGENVFIAVDTESHTYDPHYLVGVYYQANTATAGYGGLEQLTAEQKTQIVTSENGETYNGKTVYSGQNGTKWIYVNGTVKNDICPKGWQLPNIEGNNGTVSNLIRGYGFKENSPLTSTAGTYQVVLPDGRTANATIQDGQYDFAKPPLYITRSGTVYLNYSAVRNVGSRTMLHYNRLGITTEPRGYVWGIVNNLVKTQDQNERWLGSNIRCVSIYE